MDPFATLNSKSADLPFVRLWNKKINIIVNMVLNAKINNENFGWLIQKKRDSAMRISIP